jgi:hypothetical protein
MEDHEGSSSSPPYGLLAPVPADTRNRGDSLSSDSCTSDCRNPQLSFTSGSGASPLLSTPGNGSIFSQDKDKVISFFRDEVLETSGGLNERRTHAPLDIDITSISSISSHAQAEALVERARQEALDLASTQDLSLLLSDTGRTPLSARLAAYGESLALERKLREQKEQRESTRKESRNAAGLVLSPLSSTLILKGPEGVERQQSLEDKSGIERVKRRPKDPRRPSTADGSSTLKKSESILNLALTLPFLVHSPNLESKFLGRSASHHSSHSTPIRLDDDTQKHPPLQRITPHTVIPVFSTKSDSNQPVTSRTLHASPDESLSRISSFDGGADTEIESPTLYRVSTAPLTNTGRGREVRSANKLTRMGYPANEQAVSRTSPSSPPTSKRFGAIKSFMQTFKGKA